MNKFAVYILALRGNESKKIMDYVINTFADAYILSKPKPDYMVKECRYEKYLNIKRFSDDEILRRFKNNYPLALIFTVKYKVLIACMLKSATKDLDNLDGLVIKNYILDNLKDTFGVKKQLGLAPNIHRGNALIKDFEIYTPGYWTFSTYLWYKNKYEKIKEVAGTEDLDREHLAFNTGN